ncbi:unnamed protein product [Schistosoma turkestanicum]|nr:unnamed protein product [Schistosoma turkestanicum]
MSLAHDIDFFMFLDAQSLSLSYVSFFLGRFSTDTYSHLYLPSRFNYHPKNIRQEIEEIVKNVMKSPVQLRDKCSQLSPGFLYYDECEQACDSDRFYGDCIKMCEPGDSPSGWSCLTGCRFLDAALKKRSGDCPEQIGLAIHRIPSLVSVKNDVQNFPSHESRDSSQLDLDKHISLTESNSGLRTNMPENSWFAQHGKELNEINSCTVDGECPQKQDKCCQSQCKPAVFNKAILPPIPTIRILEEKHPPSFLVSWDNNEMGVSNLSLPTVYILQVKSYFGPEYDSRMSSPWKTLVVVSECFFTVEYF